MDTLAFPRRPVPCWGQPQFQHGYKSTSRNQKAASKQKPQHCKAHLDRGCFKHPLTPPVGLFLEDLCQAQPSSSTTMAKEALAVAVACVPTLHNSGILLINDQCKTVRSCLKRQHHKLWTSNFLVSW